MHAPRMFTTVAVAIAAAAALLLSGCGSSSTATAPTEAASETQASSATPGPSTPVSSAAADAPAERVIAKWTCERGDGTEVTCTCEGSEADCKSTVAKPSTLKGVTGMVKWFNAAKGFGFIAPEGGGMDVFVHISAVERAGLATLETNQKVQFQVENDKNGRVSAGSLTVLP
jgi:CspA family cold shock protein